MQMTPNIRAANLLKAMPEHQRAAIVQAAHLGEMSIPAVMALQLCAEALRDYCPPDETIKVIAALIGLENRKAK